MKGLRDNKTARSIAAGLLFLLSGAMFFLDWWSASFIAFKEGITPLELGELSDQLNNVAAWLETYAGSSLRPWIITLLVIVWGAIIHAVVCRALRKTYRGSVVPAVVLASVIAAAFLAEKMDMSITAIPFLALTFAVAGFVLAPSKKSTKKETSPKRDPNRGVIEGVSGVYKGATFTIEDGETLAFGRDPAICHVVFETSNISRTHCTIRYSAAENSYYVKDTSRNGTYYADGIRMQPQREMPVTAGEKIYLDNPNEMFRLG